jgi:hypothetical protein
MRKALLGTLAALGLAGFAAPAWSQGACTRAGMQSIADKYIEAQKQGFPLLLPLGTWANYNEQMELMGMGSGIISKELKIDFFRTLIDSTACQTFTEVIVTDPAHPYVLGTAISARGPEVNAVDILVTDKGDWLFSAKKTLEYSRAENWGVIPPADRDSRDVIKAAADAYLNLFKDKKTVVPWGSPCARLEGGIYTAKGGPGVVSPEDSCNVGVPDNIDMINRRYIIDETIGAVAVLLNMGPNKRPDSHTFRIEKGKIRYVHTITVCKEENCGFKMDEATKARLES